MGEGVKIVHILHHSDHGRKHHLLLEEVVAVEVSHVAVVVDYTVEVLAHGVVVVAQNHGSHMTRNPMQPSCDLAWLP